jgi:methionine-rich copper-binding protein CopC
MNMRQLVLLFSLSLVLLTACKKDRDLVERTNNNIVLNGAQAVPTSQSTANGKMTATYSSKTKTFNYTVTWAGLSGNASSMHIHGVADAGSAAAIVQTITLTAPNNGPSGSVSGSLFVDGFTVKEEDLLNGKYYIDIHTASAPGGELRGQITF